MKQSQLSNGLPILMHKRLGESVTLLFVVHAASAHEHHAGCAHALEHMLFENTQTRVAMTRAIDRVGGEVNASTSKTHTEFYIRVAKKHFALACKVLSKLVCQPTLDAISLTKEKEIILQEIALYDENPRHVAFETFETEVFRQDAFSASVLGTRESVKSLTINDLQSFYDSYYHAKNAVLVVVGDFDSIPKEVDAFATLAAGGKKKVLPPKQTTHKPELVESKSQYIFWGVQTLPIAHPQYVAYDVLSYYLGATQSSVLHHLFRHKQGLCYDVGAQHLGTDVRSFFLIYAALDPQYTQICLKLFGKALDSAQQITRRKFVELQTALLGRYTLEIEDHLMFAQFCAYAYLEKTQPYVERIQATTYEDVIACSKNFLRGMCISYGPNRTSERVRIETARKSEEK